MFTHALIGFNSVQATYMSEYVLLCIQPGIKRSYPSTCNNCSDKNCGCDADIRKMWRIISTWVSIRCSYNNMTELLLLALSQCLETAESRTSRQEDTSVSDSKILMHGWTKPIT